MTIRVTISHGDPHQVRRIAVKVQYPGEDDRPLAPPTVIEPGKTAQFSVGHGAELVITEEGARADTGDARCTKSS